MKFELSVSLLALKDFSQLEEFLLIPKTNKIKYIELPITKLLPIIKLKKK